MLWTILFYVNPVTITVALVLSFAAALPVAWLRPPMRAVAVGMAAVYLLVLAAPLSEHTGIGEGDRSVVRDPMPSSQDIGGETYPSAFGIMIDGEGFVHYFPHEPTAEERAEWNDPGSEKFFVHGEPGDGLVVTDVAGRAVDAPRVVAMVEEELELQEAHARRIEEEGPWGHTDGLALQ